MDFECSCAQNLLSQEMLIKQKHGNISGTDLGHRKIDALELEWFETRKRILHKKTVGGRDISLKLLGQNEMLTEGDILHHDSESAIVVFIKPCEAIVIRPRTTYEMAYACYEIGNKHLPLFYENEELLVPFESPLLKMLQASGLPVDVELRKLVRPLKTSVTAHLHSEGRSLFSRILHLTSPNE